LKGGIFLALSRAAAATCLLLWSLVASAAAVDSVTHDDVEWLVEAPASAASAGTFQASFLEDREGIALLEVEGNYDRNLDGAFNFEPRALVGQAYFGDHQDDADVLVIFTTFDFDTGPSTAFHLGVRNDIEGIGAPIFDNSSLLGSEGRLQSYVDMAVLSRYGTDPLSSQFDIALSVLAHEVMHRWCCYVNVRQPGGGFGADLLGEGGSHWSYLLDSDASLMYGADWRPNGDGTHTAVAVNKFYNPLDLYLAGFLEVEEVPPFTLLENPDLDPLQIPELGATVTAEERIVTLDDVLTAEGPRIPAAGSGPGTGASTGEIRLAFLILTRPGVPVTEGYVASVDRLRRAFSTRFAALTGGRGIAHVLPEGEAEGSPGAPTPVDGGPPRPSAQSSVADGLLWLRSVQGAEGFWQDTVSTRVRDTTAALGTLSALDPSFPGRALALNWLEDLEPFATDALARALKILSGEGQAPSAGAARAQAALLERQNGDGGWGADAEMESDPLDTALALAGLAESGELAAGSLTGAVDYLMASQGSEGGWSPAPGAAGRISVTALMVRALLAGAPDPAALLEPALNSAAAWLAERQNSQDGGFGDGGLGDAQPVSGVSTAHDTALALLALAELDALDLIDVGAAEVFLRSRQTQEGSWDGSVFTTAVAITALQQLELPNLALGSEILVDPGEPRDGERVRLEATVANAGGSSAPPSLVRFFAGDPALGGPPLGVESAVPALAPGEQVVVGGLWDTTDGAGEIRIFALVDPDFELLEAREDDNSASVQVTVAPPPEGVDLELRTEDIAVSPPFPSSLPVQLAITTVVRNFGLADATDVQVTLWRGTPENGEMVETVVLPGLAGRSSLPANFTDLLTEPGTALYTVAASTVPPDEDSANNRASFEVSTQASTDLEVLAADLSLSRDPAFLGTDVTVTSTLHNRGTLVAPTFMARYSVASATETVVIRELAVSIPAGESLEQSFPWRVDRTGALTLLVELDPEQRILEADETNNQAELPFEATAVTEPNLTLALADLRVSPEPALEGSFAELAIQLRNTGGTDLSGVAVAFHDANPNLGGVLVGEMVVESLNSGEDRVVTVPWPALPDASDRLIFATADPQDAVAEFDEEDNQVFRRLTVLSLPDIALGSASLTFDPPVPLPGQAVELAVAVANLGEQGTGAFVVRAYSGDPAAALQLGTDQTLDLEGLSQGEAIFSFVPPVGTQIVTVVADEEGAVLESEEGNNRAEQNLAAQDPDFAAAPRYFSPNGDGVQDSTVFTYRLTSARTVDIRVVDARGRVLRRERGSAATANGSFLWDGRDDAGRIAPDGELLFEVVSVDGAGPTGEVLGAASVVLDVDRSPLHEALGTELEQFTNLSCLLGEVSAQDLAEGGEAIYLALEGDTPELREGLYRVPLTRPVPESLTAGVAVRRVAVAADGSRVAWQQSAGPQSTGQTGVWSADAFGSGVVRLTTGGGLVGISGGGERVVTSFGSPALIRSVPSDGSGAGQDLLTLGGTFSRAVASRDHRFLAILEGLGGSPSGPVKTWLLDLEDDTSFLIQGLSELDVDPAFSPDGSLLALANTASGRVRTFSTEDGALVGDLLLPVETFPRQLLTESQRALAADPWVPPFVAMDSLDWSPQGDSLIVVARFGTPNCQGAWRLFKVQASTLALEGSVWIEPFLPVDPDVECSDDPDLLTQDRLTQGPLTQGPGAGSSVRSRARATAFGEEPVLLPFFGSARFLNPADRILVGSWSITEEGEVEHLFHGFDDLEPEILLEAGRGLLFRSADAAEDPSSSCFERGGEDIWSFFSRLNLSAELLPRRTPDQTAILLDGTAADLNFASYHLEWRERGDAPGAWSPVAPPSSRRVLDGSLGTWIPPTPGAFLLRLTVRDKAGNQRSVVRQVATANAPAITNLVAAPEVFSAQPGAAITHTELSYDVEVPVNLTVLIFDSDGQRVRAFQRSHGEPSVGVTLLWDGRDDFGEPVGDGSYRIQVQGYEVYVEVDSTPPAVRVEMGRSRFGGRAPICEVGFPAARADLSHFLISSFDGEAEGGSLLEVGEGLAPSTWRPISSPTSVLELEIPEAVGRRYRGRAEDEVGNSTLRLADLPPEDLTLISLDPQLPVYYPDPFEEPEDLPPYEDAPILNLVPDGPLRVGIRETLRTPLTNLFLQYQLPEEPGMWREVPAESYFTPGSPSGTLTPPEHELEALFATGLPAGAPLAVRLRAVDGAGNEHVSNLGGLFLWSVTYRGRLRPGDLDEGAPFAEGLAELLAETSLNPVEEAVFWGSKRLEDPAVGVYLRVRSDFDPDYEDWRRVEPVAASEGLFILSLPDLDPEAEFQVRVGREEPVFCTTHDREDSETEVCGGQRPMPCQTSPPPVRRLELTALPGFTEEAVCGATAHGGLRVSLRPFVQGDLVAESLQLFAGEAEIPGEEPVFEIADPLHQRLYLFDELLSLPLAEEQVYRAILIGDDGQRVEKVVRFPVDEEPPMVLVEEPLEGQRVCPVEGSHRCGSIGGGAFFLPIFGRVEDNLSVDYRMSLLLEDDGEPVELPFADAEGNQVCYAGLGQLGAYGDHPGEVLPSGPMTLRVLADDAGGNILCQEVSFVLDASVEPVAFGVASDLFSPNGDGVVDEALLRYTSQEATELTLTIYPGVAPGVASPDAVRRVTENLGVVGSGEVAWDGRNDLGSVVADGRYLVHALFADDCGNKLERQQWVEVDTTQPSIAVLSPAPGDPLGLVVEVVGVAEDRNFQRYDVAWGSAEGGGLPEVFVDLGGGTGAVPGSTLAVWDTTGLVGEVVLRLLATDLVGNASELFVPLSLPERLGILGGAEALPSLFSPNGDGALDSTVVRFSLDQSATVDLEIVDEAGEPVRSLLQASSLPSGSRLEEWNGSTDGGVLVPSGRYQALLRASSSTGELEEAVLPLIVDREAPTLEIQEPLEGGFIRSAGEVMGSAEDAHLELWSLDVSAVGLGAWEPLAEGHASVVGGVLTSLGSSGVGGLEEGSYDLRLRARDRAANSAEAVVSFQVDETPPAALLLEPVEGVHVSGLAGEVTILGSVEEENLAFYRLEVGAGAAPAEYSSVAESTTLPVAGLLAQWEVAAASDGPMTLRLVAEDLAGGRAEDRSLVTVDNTLPVVSLTTPAEGDFVTGPLDVLGTASDANLARFTLDVAPTGSSQFSPLASGEASVSGGVLTSWRALPPDGEVTLRLEAEDEAGNRSTAVVTVVVDTVPPAPPVGLMASPTETLEVDLIWDANTESDLAGYRPYRDGTLLTADLQPSPSYLDAAVGSGAFTYTVTAVDEAGNESEPSQPAEISLDAEPPTVHLSRPPEGARVSGLVEVVGTAYSQDDFQEYRLSVGDGSGGFTLLRRSPVPVQADRLGSWSSLGRPEEFIVTLRLEAEDLSGNVAVEQVMVTVDNAPPEAPLNLAATVEGGDDIRLTWDAAGEADLAGYLLMRDGVLVNAPGPVGEVTPYLLPPSGGLGESFLDADRPDGTFRYTVIAVDQAGNQSLPSNLAEATVETGAPTSVLVEPEEGTEFDEPLYLLAVSEDQDVAEVRFEVRPASETSWTNLGADLEAPFDREWDPSAEGRPYGEYLLRAVASDSGGRVDPAPGERRVFFADRTPPPPVPDLEVESVDGGEVTLRWTSEAGIGDLEGYRLLRAAAEEGAVPVVVTVSLVAGPTYTEVGVADGEWVYTAVAVDTSGNASIPSAPAPARVRTPELISPSSPTPENETSLQGSGVEPGSTVYGERSGPLGSLALDPVIAGSDGSFLFEGVALERGVNTLKVVAEEANGNRTKEAVVQVTSAPLPAAPIWQSVEVTAQVVDLSWLANSEPDLRGYLVERDGVGVPAAAPVTDATASASSEGEGLAALVQDGDRLSSWRPASADEAPWIALDWLEGRRLLQVIVEWSGAEPAVDFDLDLKLEGSWRTVVQVRGNGSSLSELPLPEGSYGTALRLRLLDPAPPAVAEIEVLSQSLVTGTSLSETLPDGVYSYTLRAVNASGFTSLPSEARTVSVGDGVPPQPVILTGSARDSLVDLSWTASADPDVVRYDLYRDGVEILRHTDLGSLNVTDGPLGNGTYIYEVAAVDVGGNRSELSNSVAVTVEIPLLQPPLLEAVVPGPASLALSWSPGAGSVPAEYRLLRSTTQGGPYGVVVIASETTFEDLGLTVGQEYFYVVRSLDSLGNASAPSNEGSGIPLDLDPLERPRFTQPTLPGSPLVTTAAVLDLAGTSEAGSIVTVLRDGVAIGVVPALDPALEVVPSLHVMGWMEPSPDGSLLAVEESGLYPSSVVDLATGAEAEVPGLTGPPRWFSDGQRIAYPNEGAPTVYDLRDESTQSLGLVAEIGTVVPGRGAGLAAERVAALASRFGGEGLWTFTAGSFLWTRQIEAPLSSFDEHSLRWSPDGSRLLVKQGTLGKTWQLVDVASGTVMPFGGPAGSSQGDWSPDGSQVVLTRGGPGGEQVWWVDTLTGEESALTTGPQEHFEPRFSPDGFQVAFLDGEGFLFLLDMETGFEAPAGRIFDPAIDPTTAGQWKWAREGMIFNRSGEVVVRSSAARFELEDVELNVGDNVFRARAEMDGGRQSPLSDEIFITRSVEGLPDLVVSEEDLLLLPSLPRSGELARLTVVVSNDAGTEAQETGVEVVVLDPLGAEVPLPSPSALPPLGPGEAGTVTLDLPGLLAGRFEIRVLVDPEEEINEVSEVNNRATRAFVVVPEAAPTVAVETDRENYLAGETVQASATVTNGGENFSGELQLDLEDELGRPVQRLATVPVVDLAFGATVVATTEWESGGAFAGIYRVAARLADGDGVGLDETSALFELAEDFAVSASASGDRQVYVQGEEAVLGGALLYETGNTVLDGVQTYLRVEGPDGSIVAQWSREVGTLLPLAEVREQQSWSTHGEDLGSYRIVFEATRFGRPMAEGEGSFEVTSSAPSFPALQGSKVAELAVDADGDGRLSPGDTLLYRIQIESVGDSPALESVLEDPIPAPATLVAGSVVTDRGSVEGENPVRVALGDLTPGDTAEVTFRVLLPTPWPVADQQLVNQGVLSSSQISQVPTDDPSTVAPADPTVSEVFVSPLLVVTKVDALIEDRDGDGVPGAGDVLGYVVTASNLGSAAATGLRFTDFIPTHTSAVPGSLVVSAGSIENEDPVTVNLPSLAPGELWSLAFEVEVDGVLPLEVRQVSNQASIASAELPVILSDDPDRPGSEDPTLTAVTAEAQLFAEKRVTLAVDRDGDGVVSPGDSLRYEIEVGNRGNSASAGVLMTDSPSVLTVVEAGSVEVSAGSVLTEDPVVVELGLLETDSQTLVTFLAQVQEVFPVTEMEVSNQATVTSFDGVEPVLSDDPATPELGDPTRIEVFITPEVDATDATAVEGDLSITFAVELSEPSNRAVTMAFGTEDGSAVAGEDYVATSGTLTLEPGASGGEVTVQLLDDALSEGSETFVLLLEAVDGGVLLDGQGEGEILDDDVASGLAASLSVTLLEDLNGDSIANPGETLELQAEIVNGGEATLTGVSYEAAVPEWTEVVSGSITTSTGVVTSEDPVRVEIPALEAAEVIVLRYRAVVADPIPRPQLEISTQGMVRSDQLEPVLTDDPTRPGTADPSLIDVEGETLLNASLSAEILARPDPSHPESSTAQGGDLLLYRALLNNPGTAALNGAIFVMDIPVQTSLLPGSVVVSQGSILDLDPLTVDLQEIWPGSPAELHFEVRIDDVVPSSVRQIVAQGWISSLELPDQPTDDPTIPGEEDPTVVLLEQMAVEIPALHPLGLVGFALLLLLLALVDLRRRRASRPDQGSGIPMPGSKDELPKGESWP